MTISLKISGYNNVSKEGRFNRRQQGGVALYIHASMPFIEIALDMKLQAVAAVVNVTNFKTIRVSSNCIPLEYDLQETALKELKRQLEGQSIIMGDFKPHHTLWGNKEFTEMENWAWQDECNILNDGKPAYISGTAIVLTIVKPALASEIT